MSGIYLSERVLHVVTRRPFLFLLKRFIIVIGLHQFMIYFGCTAKPIFRYLLGSHMVPWRLGSFLYITPCGEEAPRWDHGPRMVFLFCISERNGSFLEGGWRTGGGVKAEGTCPTRYLTERYHEVEDGWVHVLIV